MFRKDDALGPSVNNRMGGLRMSTLQLQTGGQIIAKSPGQICKEFALIIKTLNTDTGFS
jgi:hypothetical protein